MNISLVYEHFSHKHTLCSHFQLWSSQYALGPEIIIWFHCFPNNCCWFIVIFSSLLSFDGMCVCSYKMIS